jgi:hypothetical protein
MVDQPQMIIAGMCKPEITQGEKYVRRRDVGPR